MALAAGVTTLQEVRRYAATRPAWEGIPLYREAVALSNECFRSGPEVFLYLRWLLDAGLPEPLVNPPVFDLGGRLLGYPDLLDPEAGVVGEYDGAAHRSRDRHRRDVAREDRFRDAGWSTSRSSRVTSPTSGWSSTGSAPRRRRALFLPASERQLDLTPPPWWRPPPWLPARYRGPPGPLRPRDWDTSLPKAPHTGRNRCF